VFKVLWAGMFALGIDTAFALSWVRVRQCVTHRQCLSFVWNMLLALAMSLIVFQPLAVRLLEKSLGLNFNQALASLSINMVFLTYARSGIAVFLGAILSMTNAESAIVAPAEQGNAQPKREIILFKRLLDKVAPVVSSDNAQPAQVTVTEVVPAQTPLTAAQDDADLQSMQQLRAQKVSEIGLSGLGATSES
jgi:hypothetical protein